MKKKLKFLFIDDNFECHYLAESILKIEKIDCEIAKAWNGYEALRLVEENGFPDIILLDVSMPVMDGFEFLAAYKNMKSSLDATKIYVVSSSLVDWIVEKFETIGIVNGFFEKPFRKEHLQIILHDQMQLVSKNIL